MRSWIILSLLVLGATANAQYQLNWERHLNGPISQTDTATTFVLDEQNNIYVVGTVDGTFSNAVSNISVTKYDPSGTLLWSRTYDGPAGGQDLGADIALSNDSVYVVGRTMTPNTSSECVTLRYDKETGALMWTRLFDGPANSVDGGVGCATDPFGNVFVVGHVWNDAHYFSNGDFVTLKYDSAGNLAWSKLYHGLANYIAISDYPSDIAADHNGDVIITGDSPGSSNISDYATIKYRGSDGEELWVQRYTGTGQTDVPHRIQVTSDNDVIVGGSSRNGSSSIAVLRYDGATGAQEWLNSGLTRGSFGLKFSMVVDAQDNVAITSSWDPDFDDSNLNNNLVTAKFSGATGVKLWETYYGTNTHYDWQSPRTVNADPAGNVVIVGRESLPGGQEHYLLQKYESLTGVLLWSATHFGPVVGGTEARRVMFDGVGDLIMAGNNASSATSNGDIHIAKFGPGSTFLLANQLSAQGGTVTGGNVVSTHWSDNVAVSVSGQNSLQTVLTGFTPVFAPSSIQFQMESRTTVAGCRGTVQLWDVVSGSWTSIGKFVTSLSDTTSTFTVNSGMSRYVEPLTKAVKARILWSAPAAERSKIVPFTAMIDASRWDVIP